MFQLLFEIQRLEICCLHTTVQNNHVVPYNMLQGVPLATEPGISLIILPLMRILQRNLKRTYRIV